MAWTPDFISWTIDNKEVRRITKDDPSVKLTNKPQSVMMNFWTPTFESWGKGFDPKDMPWYVEYDYVETYAYNTETHGFDFLWRDNFNTFDTNRWHKADNTTFDANSTTFRASQAFIRDAQATNRFERVSTRFSAGAPLVQLVPDRLQMASLGVDLSTVVDTLGASFGSDYVNDSFESDQVRKVIVQLDGASRRRRLQGRARAGMRLLIEHFAPLHQIVVLTCHRKRYQGLAALDPALYGERVQWLDLGTATNAER